jgi:hypothetical protein
MGSSREFAPLRSCPIHPTFDLHYAHTTWQARHFLVHGCTGSTFRGGGGRGGGGGVNRNFRGGLAKNVDATPFLMQIIFKKKKYFPKKKNYFPKKELLFSKKRIIIFQKKRLLFSKKKYLFFKLSLFLNYFLVV